MKNLAGIGLFIAIFMALLSLSGVSVFSIASGGKLFRADGQRKAGRLSGSGFLNGRRFGRYRLRLAAILKGGALGMDVGGFLRIKALAGAAGLAVGLLIKNPLLGCVLLAGLFWAPDIYGSVTSLRFSKAVDASIETTMGIITNSYMQNEDIKSSILENIGRIDDPLRGVFREFLAETGFVDASVPNAILRMKDKVDNCYFADWCDILLQCQEDHELKYVLPSIVAKLNSVKKIQVELDSMMLDIYKEFIYVVGIVILNIPLMTLINAEWAQVLFGTGAGKAAVAFCFAVIFAASSYVVSVNKSLIRM
jgi:tight adherence protein B